MQPYVTLPGLILIGLPIAGSLVLALASAALKQKPKAGWRQVRAGGGLWIACIGSAAFGAVIAWVWVFVGSNRSDAAAQMRVAWWLAFVFGLAALVTSILMVRCSLANVVWRGRSIESGRGANRIVRQMDDIAGIDHPRLLGRPFRLNYSLHFKDGPALSIDENCDGAHDLMQSIFQVKGMADYLDPPEH